MSQDFQEKIKKYNAFWRREPMERPLLSYIVITPEMVDVDAFAKQTAERLELSSDSHLPCNFLRSVSPFDGIP